MSKPFLVTTVSVASVARLSPSFLRIEVASPELADFGCEGGLFDQRIKLIFPGESGTLPALDGADDWYAAWLALPADERGCMRTYSVRELRGAGAETRLVIDFVLHLEPGKSGPACEWASRAAVGDRIVVIGPRRGASGGGIEFAPGNARHLLLCGDETAVPAICRILADLPADARGTAWLEVPHENDVHEVDAPAGVAVTWLPRAGAEVGARLVPTVVAHLGGETAGLAERRAEAAADELRAGHEIWETPTFPGDAEPIEPGAPAAGIPGLYAWIAGESAVVTTLRRSLVKDLGVDRKQVAFMGYWRKGVAMRA
jgi:NADPH-dependent ferric siderophore reductase